MRAKRKVLFVAVVLAAGSLLIHACTWTSTSVSGQLSIVTFEGTTSEAENLDSIPLSSIRFPRQIPRGQDISMAQLPLESGHEFGPEFMPDEIIVQYRYGVDHFVMQNLAQMGGYQELRTSPPYEGFYPPYEGFRPPVEDSVTTSGAAFSRSGGTPRAVGAMTVLKLPDHESRRLSPSALRDRTLREIERLNTLSSVEFAQPNYLYRPAALPNLPNDALYSYQWHYPLIKLDHVWSENLVDPADLTNVIVAVIDTGIARSNGTKSGNNHDDLGGAGTSPFVDEYDFISSASRARDGDGYDNDATDLGDHPPDQPDLASFHGTHVIGTIGAYTGNTTGVAGVAGGPSSTASVRIMPLRALGYGGGTTADIVDAIKYAARIPNSTGKLPSEPADIINMSLGGAVDDSALRNAVDAAYNNGSGVLVIAAAGNNGTLQTLYPAGYSSVMSVSAVDIGAEVASYSNYNSTVEVAAPGGSFSFNLNLDEYVDGVLSTTSEVLPGDTYKTNVYIHQQGTSMAAPHVAGLAALIKANNPSLTAAQIRSRIQSHVIDLGSEGRDDFYGLGMINAYASLKNGSGMSPVLFPFPKKMKFMGNNPSSSLTLRNIGNSSDITLGTITAEYNDGTGDWLDFAPVSSTVNDTGTQVSVSVDTDSYPTLLNGKTYTAFVPIPWGSTVEHVYVLYNVNGFPKNGIFNIGTVYVVAIDIEELESENISYYDATSYGERYAYRVGALPSGSYIIGASTDHDGDLKIFEDGDIYGFYQSLDQIIAVDVNTGDNITGIDFPVIEEVPEPQP